jgi:hypothetical protein
MRKVPLSESLKIIGRGSLNWIADRPIVVSFEVTDSCTCHCLHCDHGGPRDDSRHLRPSSTAATCRNSAPALFRSPAANPGSAPDLVEVVRNIQDGNGLPYTILVSSWSLMTADLYLQLREAGVDQFSVSLDERHDNFRCYPGLYRHLEDLVPKLAALGHDDIVLNSCITSENQRDQRYRRQGPPMGRQSLLQRLLRPPHRLPRLPPCLARATHSAERSPRPRRSPARLHPLDRQQPQHPRRHPPLRKLRHARLQGRPSFPRRHRRGALQPCSMQFQR